MPGAAGPDAAAAAVRVHRLPHGADLPLPRPASPGSAGLDLRAAIAGEAVLEPGARLLVPTGIALELPAGWEGQVRPRSGLALEHGVTLLNSPGTVDSDYRGEVQVLLVNLGQQRFTLRRGDRIAQLVVARAARVELVEAQGLEASERDVGGFGSTGVD